MKHYLITPFNLKLKWGGRYHSTGKNYLGSRFSLFEKYTFPSVKGQTVSNFDWLVLFSDSTPDIFKERIAGYQNEMQNFIPVFIKDEEAEKFREILVQCISDDTDEEYIITSRCDNDDSLSRYFIENVQKNFTEGPDFILSFPNGYQYDEKTEVLRKYYFPTSHFTSFVSGKKERTIYSFLHMDIFDNCEVKQVETAPLWIEVVHGGDGENISNCMGSVRLGDYVKEYDLFEEFNIPLTGKRTRLSLFFMYIYFALHKLWVKRKRIGIAIRRSRERHGKCGK